MDDFCETLIDLVEDMSKLEYASNKLNNKSHQRSVEGVIEKRGIEKYDGSNKQEVYYRSEPNGTQQPPDIRVYKKDNEEKTIYYCDIECKSCENGYKPMWNANYPSNNMIYVYANKKDNRTIVFTGDKLVSPEIRGIFEDYKTKTKQLELETNKRLADLSMNNPYRMAVYARNMFVQKANLEVVLSKMYLEECKRLMITLIRKLKI